MNRTIAAVSLFACLVAMRAEAAVISTKRVVGSGVSQPLFATHAPGDRDRLFILEKGSGSSAQIKILNLATGSLNASPFLTVSGLSTSGERGLLGLAFAPDYQTSKEFYVYSTATTGALTVSRYTASTADTANPTANPLLSIPHATADNHNGGWMGFSPNDGYLYVATGDGGGSNDPDNNGQNTNVLLGKMLRLDVSGTGAARPYTIPATNPFAGATPGADEIWAYGLRNPWRNAFDRQTGSLYIADVGQGSLEEINFQPANSTGGQNYGWDIREGTSGAAVPGSTDPFYQYSHGSGANQGNSISGGYVYRGPVLRLQDKYFFSDYVNARIWSVKHNGTATSPATATTEFLNWGAAGSQGLMSWTNLLNADVGSMGNFSIVSYGEDQRGHLYIVDVGGEVFKIVSNEFADVSLGAGVTRTVGGGLGTVGGSEVTFASVTGIGEFGSQYVQSNEGVLDPAIWASMTFPAASNPEQLWWVTFDGEFTGSATLTFRYDDTALLIPETDLRIYHRLDNGSWVLMPLLNLDTLNNRITISTTDFSPFALGGFEALAIPIPEPSTLVLLGLGLIGVTIRQRRVASLSAAGR